MQQFITALAERIRWRDDDGASLVEYVFLVALIAVVCITAVAFMGTSVSESFDSNTSAMFVGP